MNEVFSVSIEWFHLSPLIALVGGTLFLLVAGSLTPRWPRGLYAIVAAITAGATGVLAMFMWDDITDLGPTYLAQGALRFDVFTQFLTIAVCAATLLVILVTNDDLQARDDDGPEVYALFLAAAAGAIVMGAANDLIVLFLGLETLSLALYVLAASDRRRRGSQEAGLKYFILGGFASAILLYGIALLYGATQTTNISLIASSFAENVVIDGRDTMALAALALLLVGLAFKVAAVPFHMWAPDVYQGAPSNVTGFMASVAKAAAFAAMLRVLAVALPTLRDDWRPIIWVLAVASLIVGSLLAAVQTDMKRMLAYSSISHAGYILVGVEALSYTAGNAVQGQGMPSVMTYLLCYSVMTVGSFAIVGLVSRSHGNDSSLSSIAGFGRRRPALALGLTVFLLAQAGVPFTAGFIAKWGVIQAAIAERSYALGIIAMIAAVIAAVMYLRIMMTVWAGPSATEAAHETGRERVPLATGLAVAAAAIFTIYVGVNPGWLIDASQLVTQMTP